MKKKYGFFLGTFCLFPTYLFMSSGSEQVKKLATTAIKDTEIKKNGVKVVSKKSPKKKEIKKAAAMAPDPLRQAAECVKKSLGYLTSNAYFMSDIEPEAQETRRLAVDIYKTEAYCTFKLAGLSSLIDWEYPQNPLEDADVYYKGVQLFNEKVARVFGDLQFHKTQAERLMFTLRGCIHENLLSLIHTFNNYLHILSGEEFKYGGHSYENVHLDDVIDLYDKLASQTTEWIDKSYQKWQVAFYRSVHFMLTELARRCAPSFHNKGEDDVYLKFKAIGESSSMTIEKIKKLPSSSER